MTARHAFLVAGAAALLVAGAIAAKGADSGAIALGQNLAGESCSAVGAASPSKPLEIVCGSSADGAGTLTLAPLALAPDASARHAAILAAAKGFADPDLATCGDAQWLDGDNALFICTVQSNSWPRIALVAGHNGMLYRAEGLPSLLPVLQTAVAKVSGRGTSQQASQAGLSILKAKFSNDVMKSSAADFSSYRHIVEMGRLDGGADNYAQAETDYRNALAIETRLFGPDSIAVGETLAELALQVSNQGRFDEAAALFQRATPIIQGAASAASRARLASYLALNTANQRNFTDALKFAHQATAARRSEVNQANEIAANGGPPVPATTRGDLAHSLRIEAEMALRLGDLASAQASADEALWIISEEPGLPLWWRPDAVALMAEVNVRQGRTVVAERDFQDALGLDRKLFGDTAPTARLELRIGQFYSDEQVYPAALTTYRAAFAILAKDPVARSQVVPDQIVPFITAALASNGGPALDAEIFRASQYANSDVADQTIAHVAARRAAGDPALAELVRQADDAARLRDSTRMDLAAEYAKPDDERNGAKERDLDAQVKAASARADQLTAKLHASYPAYAEMADPGPAELANMRALLKPGDAFLSFVVGAKMSYALLVTDKGLTARQLDVADTELAQDIADLREAFVPKLGRLPEFSVKSSFALYRQLLGPLENELASVDHLIVAPTGDLSSLPFALLVTAAPRDGAEHSYSQAAWLLHRMALSQVPSARALVLLHNEAQNRAPASRPFLGVGDPAFTGAPASTGRAMQALAATCQSGDPVAPELLRALPRLGDTRHEVETVGAALGGSPAAMLLGAGATEGALRAQPLEQYRVVYFATHGLLPGELHCQGEPALVLSPPERPAATANADGVLYASEIAGLKLNADLVVLSACNTAAAGGNRFGGGALEGLADSFFSAGARAVLASHWEVPSAATMRLMTGVFADSKHDSTRGLAEALRQSQLALIAQPATAHPFNWAAFTLIGGDDAASTAAVKTAQGEN